ncbi:hypothetical protein RIF23_20490 [Lipingzhangella sp. LS1_29]|uniref:Trichodiene synthase n=1 Tax=Lipingzhangella rawalii TaxID=2055835 RepID=A0ABU2HBH2_9ACTN|nr:hypothetical protein [Lipingzhangella rawalii]MDS1272667.1 hypothetical protein [Lipingzhangella rawalii]
MFRNNTSPNLRFIENSDYRSMVGDVIHSGLFGQAAEMGRLYRPQVNRAQIAREIEVLTSEFQDYGINVPRALIKDLVLMRGIQLPTSEDKLALALSRAYVFGTYADDICCRSRNDSFDLLQGCVSRQPGETSQLGSYADMMLNELGEFSDKEFMGPFGIFFYMGVLGCVVENEFAEDVTDSIDTQYVRSLTGFCEMWFTSLQFLDPCLYFSRNMGFWAPSLSFMVKFLNDFNDLLSFYKEAVNEHDFAVSRIYRNAIRSRKAYVDCYGDTLNSGVDAYHRIMDLGNEEQRPFLENYMQGFIYWHLHVKRYRWWEVYPDIYPVTDVVEKALQSS